MNGQATPLCSICWETLGKYGGPVTLPCGANQPCGKLLILIAVKGLIQSFTFKCFQPASLFTFAVVKCSLPDSVQNSHQILWDLSKYVSAFAMQRSTVPCLRFFL